jgi:hypothetical protein
MDAPVRVCGRAFTPILIQHLAEMIASHPKISRNSLANEVCRQIDWYSPNGRPALSSARVALNKLESRGYFSLPEVRHSAVHRLKGSGKELPTVISLPRQVEEVQNLSLHLISGQDDPWHSLWNDLIIQQHPCGDAPLVGTQLRYLIGSDHGWLGALGFGPASFLLGARDQWIGWTTYARLEHLREVLCLSRLLIRKEVRCANLVSKVWSMVVARLGHDWYSRYGVKPLLVETFVDRTRFTGCCFAGANWMRLGESTGQGRLGANKGSTSVKDIWMYPLSANARRQLQNEPPQPVTSCSLQESIETVDWCARELENSELGDSRLSNRALKVLLARWNDPSATFGGSFKNWADAKAAYNLIENKSPDINMHSLLSPHSESTQARMAAESIVLLAQDTTSLNYSGLERTTGLGEIGSGPARGLFLHSLLAFRTDGVMLGVLDAQSWGREKPSADKRSRNAKSIHEKESTRWVDELRVAGSAAQRLPRTQIIVMADREGDIYELHDGAQIGPPNLHVLVRAQHDRNLECHQKLWSFMAAQPLGERRELSLPRRGNRRGRIATVEIRWASATIQAPAVGPKKSWPSLTLQAIWVHEPEPPAGIEPLDWMLLTDLHVITAIEAWEKVDWYCRRWGIEEWHRVLKSTCKVEHREFKTDEHLKRALVFDLIMAWRILALVKLGRATPNVPASLLYTEEEVEVLTRVIEQKTSHPVSELTLREANRTVASLAGWYGRKCDGEPGAEKLSTGIRRLQDMILGWRLHPPPPRRSRARGLT